MPTSFDVSSYRALKHGPFRRYVLAYGLAALGHHMQSTVLLWEVYERTHSKWLLGLVGLLQVLPVLLLALVAGQLIDWFDRKRILMLSQLGFAIGSVGLAMVSIFQLPLGWLYGLLVWNGLCRTFFAPARTAFFARVLPVDNKSAAIRFSSIVGQLAIVIGPVLGGTLIAWFQQASWVYLGYAGCSGIFVGLIAGIPLQTQAGTRSPLSFQSMLSGIRYILRTRLLLSVMVLDLFAVLLGGATTLLPVYARDILHVDAKGLGWLRAAPSLGGFVMSLWLTFRGTFRRTGQTLLLCVAGFGIATVAFGLSTSFPFSLCMLMLLGAFDAVSMVIRSTLEQLLTPESLRGRVSAIGRLFIDLSNELGGFESGSVAALIGSVACVAFGGLGTLVVVGIVALCFPELRQVQRMEDVQKNKPDEA